MCDLFQQDHASSLGRRCWLPSRRVVKVMQLVLQCSNKRHKVFEISGIKVYFFLVLLEVESRKTS